jgi:EF hand domain-containing protein
VKLGGWLYVARFTFLWLVGCSHKPARVSIPDWDPPRYADAILATLDTNADGQVASGELAQAPGLAFGARFIDRDRDGKLSRDELVARFSKYRERRLGLTGKQLRLTYNGRPLVGAELRLTPEFFLTDVIEPAAGTTDAGGSVRPSIGEQSTPLMRVGYYRVQVTSPKINLPEKFSSATTMGVEVSPFPNEPAESGTIEIKLSDKK